MWSKGEQSLSIPSLQHFTSPCQYTIPEAVPYYRAIVIPVFSLKHGQEVAVVESFSKTLMSSFRAIIKLITEAFYMHKNIKK